MSSMRHEPRGYNPNMPESRPGRKALMICYHYPPISASGVIRSLGFTRLLREFGWEPVVLTVERARDVNVQHGEPVPSGITVVRTREYNLDGLIELLQGGLNRVFRLFGSELRDRFFRDWIAIPDAQIAWLSWWRGIRLARQCSVIYVSCSPYSSALTGCIIKRMTGRPLVVDFRDAWTLNPHARRAQGHQRVIERLEQWVFMCADHIVLNTEGAKALYHRRYPAFASKMSVIPNGYDRLNIADAERSVHEPFRIMHIGAFYGSRTPDELLDAVARFDGDIEFIQVGPTHPSFRDYEGCGRIRVAAQMKHADAQAFMRSASLLYLRQGWESDVTDYIAVAAKTYEYLATGLPILAHCPPGDNVELIQRYAPAAYVVTSRDGRELEAALKAAFDNRATVSPRVAPEFAATFDRANLTRRLAQVFDSVAAGGPAGSTDAVTQASS
jgi:glycosyltransferase involved in cell wall biosynthesis